MDVKGKTCQNEWHRSILPVKINDILQKFPHPTHEYAYEVSSRSYWRFLLKTCAQFAMKGGQEKKE